MRAGGWGASALSMNLGLSWIADGTAERVGRLKRRDARARQALAARILANTTVQADKSAWARPQMNAMERQSVET